MTIHSGNEHTIWEGESRNVTARATGGRFTLHYRLTTHFLYFETGGITGTRQEQIPLIAIQDVDVAQTLLQKSQKVGSLHVHIWRNGRRETAVIDSVPDPITVRDLINQTVHQVRATAHQRQLAERRDLATHRFENATGPFPAGQVVPGSVLPQPQLQQPPAQALPPAAVNSNPPQPADEVMTPERAMELLRQLGELRDVGVVTPEEFEAKKKDLLGRI
jgi:hypothetical protein